MDFVQGKRKTAVTSKLAQDFTDNVSWLLSHFLVQDRPPILWREYSSGRWMTTFSNVGNVGISGWMIDDRFDLTISIDTGNQFGPGVLHTLYVFRGPHLAQVDIVDALFVEPDEESGIKFARSSHLGMDALLFILKKIGA